MTLTFVTVGMLTNFCISGYKGLLDALLGTVIPIILLIVLYALRMLGAGDIKLFSALGAIFGVEYIFAIMGYSFIAGGIIASGFIIAKRNSKDRARHLFNYFKLVFLTQSFKPYTEFEDKDDNGKFRFAYAVFMGTFSFVVNKLLIWSLH